MSQHSSSSGTGTARQPSQAAPASAKQTSATAKLPTPTPALQQPQKPDFEKELQSRPFYHGLLPREDVEELLLVHGDFVLRKTQVKADEKFVLSVRNKKVIQHLMLHHNYLNHKKWCVHPAKSFSTLPDLVKHYVRTQEGINVQGAKLIHPVPRQKWQLMHDQIKCGQKLGEGAFGEVWMGVLKQSKHHEYQVAIKSLHGLDATTKAQRQKFVAEARIMRKYIHENVVRLWGMAVQDEPLMIVMELCPGGSLLDRIRSKTPLTAADRLRFVLEAANGLAYLESKNCVHRDIAARNCLIGVDNKVKISDFGLSLQSSSAYQERKAMNLPIRWLAPETLIALEYSSRSDVWSYGVLVWEVYSGGQDPYPGLTSADLRRKVVLEAYRMSAPELMPATVRRMMYLCWTPQPSERPAFSQVHLCLVAEQLSAVYQTTNILPQHYDHNKHNKQS